MTKEERREYSILKVKEDLSLEEATKLKELELLYQNEEIWDDAFQMARRRKDVKEKKEPMTQEEFEDQEAEKAQDRWVERVKEQEEKAYGSFKSNINKILSEMDE